MNLQKLGIAIAALIATSVNLLGAAKPASSVTLLGLPRFGYPPLGNPSLLLFDSDKPSDVTEVPLTGVTIEELLGIDLRPANNLVYGLTRTSIYTIDPFSGATKLVSTLSEPLPVERSTGGVDFDPVADQLRVVGGLRQQNFSINVDTGAVTQHEQLNFSVPITSRDQFIGIYSAAYTNSDTNPATATTLYTIGSGFRQVNQRLFIQNPVDSGRQVETGLGFPNIYPSADFDIATIDGVNTAFITRPTGIIPNSPFNFSLFAINLDTGVERPLGTIGTGFSSLQGLTVLPKAVPEPTTMVGLAIVGAGLVASRRKLKKTSI